MNPLEEYFDESAMFVHLKQGAVQKAKRGDLSPGHVQLAVKI
jgi:predicted PilT family ATPase